MREKLSKQWRFQLLSITLNVNAWNIMFTVCVINRTLSLIGLEAMNSIGRQACWKAWAADADCLSVPGCLILAADIRYPGQAKAKSESKLMKASWKRFHTHKHTLITLLLVAVFFLCEIMQLSFCWSPIYENDESFTYSGSEECIPAFNPPSLGHFALQNT